MPINVIFDKVGFHHPAFGRLGRGKNGGRIYRLPDVFGEKETIEVPIMDNTAKPAVQKGSKKLTRFKYLPQSTEILTAADIAEMVEQAEQENEEPPKPFTPKLVTPEELDKMKVAGKGRVAQAQSATERTTGEKPAVRRRSRQAAPTE